MRKIKTYHQLFESKNEYKNLFDFLDKCDDFENEINDSIIGFKDIENTLKYDRYDWSELRLQIDMSDLENKYDISEGYIGYTQYYLSDMYEYDVDDGELEYLTPRLNDENIKTIKNLAKYFDIEIGKDYKDDLEISKFFEKVSLDDINDSMKSEFSMYKEAAIKEMFETEYSPNLAFEIYPDRNRIDFRIVDVMKFIDKNNIKDEIKTFEDLVTYCINKVKHIYDNDSIEYETYEYEDGHELDENINRTVNNELEMVYYHEIESDGKVYNFLTSRYIEKLIKSDNIDIIKRLDELNGFDLFEETDRYGGKNNIMYEIIVKNGDIYKWVRTDEFQRGYIENDPDMFLKLLNETDILTDNIKKEFEHFADADDLGLL